MLLVVLDHHTGGTLIRTPILITRRKGSVLEQAIKRNVYSGAKLKGQQAGIGIYHTGLSQSKIPPQADALYFLRKVPGGWKEEWKEDGRRKTNLIRNLAHLLHIPR
jgi:hypothetical protein